MRTKITIIFESHGSGTVHQHDDWGRDLLERISFALRLPEPTGDDQYPPTFTPDSSPIRFSRYGAHRASQLDRSWLATPNIFCTGQLTPVPRRRKSRPYRSPRPSKVVRALSFPVPPDKVCSQSNQLPAKDWGDLQHSFRQCLQ